MSILLWGAAGCVVALIAGSFVGFIQTIGNDARPVEIWLSNHGQEELTSLFAIAATFLLDWIVVSCAALGAALMVKNRLIAKVFAFSACYALAPRLLSGFPALHGRGLLLLGLFTLSIPVVSVAVAYGVSKLRRRKPVEGFPVIQA